jgi:hypothetical protein
MKTGRYIIQSRLFVSISMFILLAGLVCSTYASAEQTLSELGASTAMHSEPALDQPVGANSAKLMLAPSLNAITVDGGNFTSRNSSTAISYSSAGCIYVSPAGYVVSRVNLPKDAVLKYLRIYFNITDATKSIGSYVTTYNLLTGDYLDIISVSSGSGYNGRGSVLSSEATATVDPDENAYTLIASLPEGSATRFCGATVYYYNPPTLTTEQLVIK